MTGKVKMVEPPGDVSYQLSSIEERLTESFSVGSTLSGDSFVQVTKVMEDDDHEAHSYDPYLDGGNTRTRNKQREVLKERSLTPSTLPINVDASDSSSSTMGDGLGDLPVLKIEIPNQHPMPQTRAVDNRSRISPALLKAQQERSYWNTIVSSRIQHCSAVHPSTAEALMQLGHAHAHCGEYAQALAVYKSAVRIFRKLHGEDHLSVAAALNKVGLLACRFSEKESLQIARKALMQSFTLRHAILGPTHVDTVESLNNIAGVHMHLYEYQPARKAYYEVFSVRKALWGKYHPSVGVVAQALGSVHLQLAEMKYADKFFRIALEVYRRNNLAPENPTMKKLKAEMNKMERIMTLHTKVEL
jgi:hypothetical protein